MRESAVPLAKNAAVRAFATAPSIAKTNVFSSSLPGSIRPLPFPPFAGESIPSMIPFTFLSSLKLNTPSTLMSSVMTDCSTRTPRIRPPRSTTAMMASSELVATAARFSSRPTSAALICVTAGSSRDSRHSTGTDRCRERRGRRRRNESNRDMSENPFGPQIPQTHSRSRRLFAPDPGSHAAFVRSMIGTRPGLSFIGR